MTSFSQRFKIADIEHIRCEKPTIHLDPSKHYVLDLPAGVGRTTVDLYIDWTNKRIYVRLVRMADGEVAWYRLIDPLAQAETDEAALNDGKHTLG